MLPEAKSEDLLYISDISTDTVLVYSYKSHAQVGQLTGFGEPYGQCVDAKGDVWITDISGSVIDEYAHGGSSPLKTLTANRPVGCSVSPDGDLAVSSGYGSRSGVLVFKGASGKPASYTNADCVSPASPGYDDKGNLYVEGLEFINSYSIGNLCELPAGGTSLGVVSLLRHSGHKAVAFNGEGSVMWDGKHMTVTLTLDQTKLAITTELSNGDLKVARKTTLVDSNCDGGNELRQVFLVGKKNTPENHSEATVAVAGNEIPNGSCYFDFNAFAYPAGGTQEWSLTVRYAYGESVSLVPR
jgi:hypothetical protein